MKNANQNAFFELLRAGLWGNDACLTHYEEIDYTEVMRLAEEQSVIGLVTAGIEHIQGEKVPQDVSIQLIGETLQLEQQNQAMNKFVGWLVNEMREAGIYSLLLKGQGIAQTYERPLWRACGDVDLFLSNDNYEKAKKYLLPLASNTENEYAYNQHLGMTIDGWVIELHGSLRNGLSSRIDRVMDEIKNDVLYSGNVRSWLNGKTQVFLLGIDLDIIFVFTHCLKHFYKEGLGLRQLCDWCRLLWTYQAKIEVPLLEKRLRKMGLESEWKAFAAFAVEYLGMPKETVPLYSSDKKWSGKADKICSFIMEVGNFGHNREQGYAKYPYVVRKACSMGRRCEDLIRHAWIFPLNSFRFFPKIMFNGLKSAVRGE